MLDLMKAKKQLLTFEACGRSVSFRIFIVLALSDHLRGLEDTLERIDHDMYSVFDLWIERDRHDDKHVLWFAEQADDELAHLYARAAMLAGRYAKENGALFLTIEEVRKRYPDLFCTIADRLREYEEAHSEEEEEA